MPRNLDALVGDDVCVFEQGPVGLRIIALSCACTGCVNSVLVFTVTPDLPGIPHAISCVIAAYQVPLAVTSAVFELSVPCIQRTGILSAHQNLAIDWMPPVAQVFGRGMLYLLQGASWLFLASVAVPQHLVVAVWFIVVALFHMSTHYGLMPRRILVKPRTDVKLLVGSARGLEVDIRTDEVDASTTVSELHEATGVPHGKETRGPPPDEEAGLEPTEDELYTATGIRSPKQAALEALSSSSKEVPG